VVPALSSALLSSRSSQLLSGHLGELVLLFRLDRYGPDETWHFASDWGHDLVFVLAARCHSFVAFMQAFQAMSLASSLIARLFCLRSRKPITFGRC
jgi:hypothetical protein